MAVTIEYITPAFRLTGDGVETGVSLSYLDYPFVNAPKNRAVSASLVQTGGGNISSVSLDKERVTLTFASAFSGQTSDIRVSLMFEE